jgi:uncharacterized protein (UPF0147 family)
MCLSNLANQAEYLNFVSNMENNEDKITVKGIQTLDEAVDPINRAINKEAAAVLEKLAKEHERYEEMYYLLQRIYTGESLPYHVKRDIQSALEAAREFIR